MKMFNVSKAFQAKLKCATLLLLAAFPLYAITIDVSDSPRSDLQLTLSAIESAQQTLYINAYEFTSDAIAQAVIKKIQAGVKVEILAEGQPVGGLGKAGLRIRSQIVDSMEQAATPDHYYVMSSEEVDGAQQRRFHFDHAKYMIIDKNTLLIGSENYSPTGNPAPGTKGTRGWESLIHDVQLANQFEQMFLADSNASFGDIHQMVNARWSGPIPYLANAAQWMSQLALTSNSPSFDTTDGPKTFQADTYTPVISPTTSLTGMLTLLRSATKRLDVEVMSFGYRWGNTGNVSPLFQAIVDAARRGVVVRVLLNDDSVFGNDRQTNYDEVRKKFGNEITRDEFLKIAKKENLKLQVTIADVDAMGVKYIHNKGVLVDGERTFISSINWNRNSVENNRETAVVVSGRDVNDYYQTLFNEDWKHSVTE